MTDEREAGLMNDTFRLEREGRDMVGRNAKRTKAEDWERHWLEVEISSLRRSLKEAKDEARRASVVGGCLFMVLFVLLYTM